MPYTRLQGGWEPYAAISPYIGLLRSRGQSFNKGFAQASSSTSSNGTVHHIPIPARSTDVYIDVYTHVHRAAVVLYPDVRAAMLQVWRRFGCILFLDLPSKKQKKKLPWRRPAWSFAQHRARREHIPPISRLAKVPNHERSQTKTETTRPRRCPPSVVGEG